MQLIGSSRLAEVALRRKKNEAYSDRIEHSDRQNTVGTIEIVKKVFVLAIVVYARQFKTKKNQG